MSSSVSASEALTQYNATHGLPQQDDISWTIDFGAMRLRFRNYAWRRRAVLFHDLHHVLTEYPCSLAGELEIAAWEFAAGPFRNPLATFFCLPLVAAGAICIPRRAFAAYVRGRHSATLYHRHDYADVLAKPMDQLRYELLPACVPPATVGDRLRYLALVLVSLLLLSPLVTLTPLLARIEVVGE